MLPSCFEFLRSGVIPIAYNTNIRHNIMTRKYWRKKFKKKFAHSLPTPPRINKSPKFFFLWRFWQSTPLIHHPRPVVPLPLFNFLFFNTLSVFCLFSVCTMSLFWFGSICFLSAQFACSVCCGIYPARAWSFFPLKLLGVVRAVRVVCTYFMAMA